MTKAVERSIDINAPVEQVFAYISDFARQPEWAAELVELNPGSAGPTGVGSTFQAIYHLMEGAYTERITVTQLVPNETLVFEGVGSLGRIVHRFQLEDDGPRTSLTKSYEPAGMRFPFNLIASFVRGTGAVRGQLDKELRNIKSKLERA